MRTFCLILVGVVVGWAASGVDWTRDAVGEEPLSATVQPKLADAEPAPQWNAASSNGPRRVFETRIVVDDDGRQRPVTVSRLVNSDGTIVPEASSPGLVGRYQVSAYGWPGGHGCYVVDTMTGKTWHNALGQPTTVAVEPLNCPQPQNLAPTLTPSVVPSPNAPEPVLYPTPTIRGEQQNAPQPQASEPAASEPIPDITN